MSRIFRTSVASVYPHYVTKVEKKGRTRAELHQVIEWLTGFDDPALDRHLASGTTFGDFFAAARLNPHASSITGTICGVRIEDLAGRSGCISTLTTLSSDVSCQAERGLREPHQQAVAGQRPGLAQVEVAHDSVAGSQRSQGLQDACAGALGQEDERARADWLPFQALVGHRQCGRLRAEQGGGDDGGGAARHRQGEGGGAAPSVSHW